MDTYKTQAQVDELTEAAFNAAVGHQPCPICGAIIDENPAEIEVFACYPCRMDNRRQPLYRTGKE